VTASTAALLDVRHLSTWFFSGSRVVRAVDDVSFTIQPGEIVGLIGESGCGKTATARSLVRLIPSPPGRIVEGEVLFDDTDVLSLSDDALRALRGAQVGFVFQDPSSSLNPVHTIGDQIRETVRLHLHLSATAATDRAIDLLARVGIPNPRDRLGAYPHEFSGGMRQRVMIAIALACNPRLLIADEPTTALDVTIQAQILELIGGLSRETGTAVLLITHNLGIAASMCDRINVMYAGQIVECASTNDLFADPAMPYTRGLLEAVPTVRLPRPPRLASIDGAPPDLGQAFAGCRFVERCAHRRTQCAEQPPDLSERPGLAHQARCFGTQPGGWLT
jgi:oligopeptide transport system ATP-binding protein